MQRVYGVIDDETFHRMNKAVDETKSSRAQWIGEAIIEKLQDKKSGPTPETMKLTDEVMKLRDENKRLNDELFHHRQLLTTQHDEQTMKIDEHNDELMMKNDEQGRQITHLNDELLMKNDELKKATQLWQDFRDQKKETERKLTEAQAIIQQLQKEIINKQKEIDQVAGLREDLIAATTARDKLQDALKSKDEDLAFLRGHLSQLSEKLPKALPPSEEEAKKKGWWQFWR
jgi:chromosome segregation ATPase